MGTNNIKAQVHMLPIEQSKLALVRNELILTKERIWHKGILIRPQHIYFTTNEEIKEGEWEIIVVNADGKDQSSLTQATKDGISSGMKVVATTNPKLWRKSVDMRGEYGETITMFLSTGIAVIDTPFMEAYIKPYNEGEPITEVLLEQVDNGGEEWMGDDYTGQPFWNSKLELKLKSNGSVVVHPVKERMYTREEFRQAVRQAWIYSNGVVRFEEWFDKNYLE